ncbi:MULTISPECIES: pentapeptide repeat-containing protein [Streptomyces]|uniref:pentapeptide repeat-containing protein n=1 Tax=Streptomyces lycopersici TaxID=2974589 RepID=UPI0021D1CFA2|nr:pentapeptide repeat-containing protein [Streptomyces sp. NEAU-383]
MSTPPGPAPSAPSWPYCGHGAEDATDPVGCRGIHVPGQTACLAHLNSANRDAYLTGLAPGTDIDHRGTRFTAPLLNALLQALRDPTTGKPHFGTARFEGTEFAEEAGFHRARFSGPGRFGGARFSSTAWFEGARFAADIRFEEALFSGTAGFGGARFTRALSETGL